jgi:ATP-binding cassette, subfamily B, bacterial PglK
MKKLNKVLNKSQKLKTIVLTLFLFFGMILEVLSLGILIPIITLLLSSEDNLTQFPLIENLYEFIPFIKENTVLFFSALILIVFSFKSIYLIYLNYRKNRFISNIVKYVSDKLYKNILSRDYNFHVKRNSAETIRNLQSDIHFFTIYLESYISLIIEIGLAVSVLVFLIIVEPFGSIITFLFLIITSGIYFRIIRRRVADYGEKRQEVDFKKNKTIIESLNGIKDIKILNIGGTFLKKFNEITKEFANINTNYTTISQFPRYMLELISIYGIFILMFMLIFQNQDSNYIITTLGIFVAGIFRLIPNVNKIIVSLQNLKYSLPSLNSIILELNSNVILNNNYSKRKNKLTASIRLNNISFNYDDKENILKNLNLEIKKGEVIGISGESGSGKSTLADILMGIQKPTSGQILVDGKNINQNPINIGYVPQKVFFIDGNIKQNIGFGISDSLIKMSKVNKCIEISQLTKFINSLDKGVYTEIGENGLMISGGQQQRIGIARAFYRDPEVLVLDESTSALDDKTQDEFLNFLKTLKGKITMILISHQLKKVNFCDKKYKVEKGNLKLCNDK